MLLGLPQEETKVVTNMASISTMTTSRGPLTPYVITQTRHGTHLTLLSTHPYHSSQVVTVEDLLHTKTTLALVIKAQLAQSHGQTVTCR